MFQNLFQGNLVLKKRKMAHEWLKSTKKSQSQQKHQRDKTAAAAFARKKNSVVNITMISKK